MNTKKRSLEKRLNNHPILKQRIESLLNVVEDTSGDVKKANEAEKKVIETLQQMGKEALETWAYEQEKNIGDELEEKIGKAHEKKNFTGKPPMEK